MIKIIFKLLFGLIILSIGAIPVLLFVPLAFKTTFEWLMIIRKLPDYVHYIIVGTIILSGMYTLIKGLIFYYKTLFTDIVNVQERNAFVRGIQKMMKEVDNE